MPPPIPPGAPPPPTEGVPPPADGEPTDGVPGVGALGTDTLGVEGVLGTVTLGVEGALGAVIVGRRSGTVPLGGVNGFVGTELLVMLLGRRLGDAGLKTVVGLGTLAGLTTVVLPVVARGATPVPPVPAGFMAALSRRS